MKLLALRLDMKVFALVSLLVAAPVLPHQICVLAPQISNVAPKVDARHHRAPELVCRPLCVLPKVASLFPDTVLALPTYNAV